LTNVNFDVDRLAALAVQCASMRDVARRLYEAASKSKGVTPDRLDGPAAWIPGENLAELIDEGYAVSILARRERVDEDVAATQELLTYGLKGLAAYVDHALVLGVEDAAVFGFVHEALDALTKPDLPLANLLGLCLKVGEVNLNPETYDRPHEFRPERFLDANPPTYAWIPFGGGIKRCLGASFSLLELAVALQTLLRCGSFEAVHDDQDKQVRRGIVLLPHRGVLVRYHS